MPPPELEELVRKHVARQVRMLGIIGGILIIGLSMFVVYLLLEIRSIKESAILLNEPLMIYNPAWDTVLDAVNPSLFPGSHRDDVRKGTLVQQWPVHGGPQHIWELHRPHGARYEKTNAPVAVQP
jgi:hypothetical protein